MSDWKSKTHDQWEIIIDNANRNHPEYSPLVDFKFASHYSIPPNETIAAWMDTTAIVSFKGKTHVPAETQLMHLSKLSEAERNTIKVHPVVRIAFGLFQSGKAPPDGEIPSLAVAVPVVTTTTDATQDHIATIQRLESEKANLERQLQIAKDNNLEDFRKIFGPGAVVGKLGMTTMEAVTTQTKEMEALKKQVSEIPSLKEKVESLELQNASLEELSRMETKAKGNLVAKAKELSLKLSNKDQELDDALAYKSEELNDSQELIDEQQVEIETLKDLIRKQHVDLSCMQVSFMLTQPPDNIDINELWDRTMRLFAAQHRSIDEAVAFAVKESSMVGAAVDFGKAMGGAESESGTEPESVDGEKEEDSE